VRETRRGHAYTKSAPRLTPRDSVPPVLCAHGCAHVCATLAHISLQRARQVHACARARRPNRHFVPAYSCTPSRRPWASCCTCWCTVSCHLMASPSCPSCLASIRCPRASRQCWWTSSRTCWSRTLSTAPTSPRCACGAPPCVLRGVVTCVCDGQGPFAVCVSLCACGSHSRLPFVQLDIQQWSTDRLGSTLPYPVCCLLLCQARAHAASHALGSTAKCYIGVSCEGSLPSIVQAAVKELVLPAKKSLPITVLQDGKTCPLRHVRCLRRWNA